MKYYNYIVLGTFLFTSIGTQISSAKIPEIIPPYRTPPVIGVSVDDNDQIVFEARAGLFTNLQRTMVNVNASVTHHFRRRDQHGRPYGNQVMVEAHLFANNSIFAQFPVRVSLGTVHTIINRLRPTAEQVIYWDQRGYVYSGTRYDVEQDTSWFSPTYEIDQSNRSYFDQNNPPWRRLSSNISKGKWKLDPIEGTKQMRYYRFDLAEPVGLDSIVITFNKTYRNANIRLLNGNTTVRMINAGYAKPNKPFVVMLDGIKVTRVEITPISSTSDIKEIHVYSTNFAHGALIQGVKGGKLDPRGGVLNPGRGTDGVKLDPQKEAYTQWDRYVSHMHNVGTRLDLEGPHNVGYVKITGLVGASDGIRNVTVTYRDIKGAVKKVENLGFHIRNTSVGTVIIEAPTKGQGSKGINDIASIDITSEDVDFRYAEIEVYGPADKPN